MDSLLKRQANAHFERSRPAAKKTKKKVLKKSKKMSKEERAAFNKDLEERILDEDFYNSFTQKREVDKSTKVNAPKVAIKHKKKDKTESNMKRLQTVGGSNLLASVLK